ncbi:MAG: CGNR zinc finger domain-containing protein [Actinomycetota bacterium]|nr:CGNR zinc finger domain-containing protein [Actinomycetota bacterium]
MNDENVSSDHSGEAPGDLAVVQAFINSADLEQGTDELATPEGLARWLRERSLLAPGDRVHEADVARALTIREGLRALAFANTGEDLDRRAVDDLNRVAATIPIHIGLGVDGVSLHAECDGALGALGWIIATAYEAKVEGTWDRFKACRKDSCRWAFYDHSKNRSRTWCSMAVCGNRIKAQTYRERARVQS